MFLGAEVAVDVVGISRMGREKKQWENLKELSRDEWRRQDLLLNYRQLGHDRLRDHPNLVYLCKGSLRPGYGN